MLSVKAMAEGVEVFSPNYVPTYFQAMSQRCGLEHYYILGESIVGDFLRNLMYRSALMEDVYVPMSAIQSVMPLLRL